MYSSFSNTPDFNNFNLKSSDLETYVSQDASNRFGRGAVQLKRLEESTNSLRHACELAGISYLPLLTTMGAYRIRYFFCPYCCRLYYYKD